MHITLAEAFASHHHWKMKLEQSLKLGEKLDVETIKRDDCCDLGKWLIDEGRLQYGALPEYTSLVSKHRDFHLVTAAVANIINNKDAMCVHEMLGNTSQFVRASLEVGMAIRALQEKTI